MGQVNSRRILGQQPRQKSARTGRENGSTHRQDKPQPAEAAALQEPQAPSFPPPSFIIAAWPPQEAKKIT